MWHWHGMGLWDWLMMAGFWVAVILLIVWATRPATAAATGEREGDESLRILDERFASGEIDRDDYAERRRVLESHR